MSDLKKYENNSPGFVEDTTKTLENIEQYANIVLYNGDAPSHFYDNQGKPKVGTFVLAVQHGLEAGLTLSQSIQEVVPINNLMTLKGSAAKALVVNSDVCEFWREQSGENDTDGYFHKIVSKRKDTGEEMERKFSVKKAKRAGLWVSDEAAKQNPKLKYKPWYKYPDRMIMWRAIGYMVNDLYPDVIKGMKTQEYIEGEVTEEAKAEVVNEKGERTEIKTTDKSATETAEDLKENIGKPKKAKPKAEEPKEEKPEEKPEGEPEVHKNGQADGSEVKGEGEQLADKMDNEVEPKGEKVTEEQPEQKEETEKESPQDPNKDAESESEPEQGGNTEEEQKPREDTPKLSQADLDYMNGDTRRKVFNKYNIPIPEHVRRLTTKQAAEILDSWGLLKKEEEGKEEEAPKKEPEQGEKKQEGPKRKWYYHPESDSYAAMSDDELPEDEELTLLGDCTDPDNEEEAKKLHDEQAKEPSPVENGTPEEPKQEEGETNLTEEPEVKEVEQKENLEIVPKEVKEAFTNIPEPQEASGARGFAEFKPMYDGFKYFGVGKKNFHAMANKLETKLGDKYGTLNDFVKTAKNSEITELFYALVNEEISPE